ncbi:MAG: transcriptional repressor, CopY family [Chloroflexi bacterium]|jgi:predicted transcriptional regulator|nr:transcriptional repressor, CopY family [Chloroflexota bacterium]
MVRKIKNEAKTGPDGPGEADEAAILAGEGPAADEEPDISVYRPDRQGVRKVLGDLEADIMEYIWEKVPAERPSGLTVREVYEAFWQNRYVAYTTIMTTMARLARKHLLRARKVDTAFVYTPILSKDEFIDNFVSRILENLLVSFSSSTENHLERLSSSEARTDRIATLKNRVATLRANQTGPGLHRQADLADQANEGEGGPSNQAHRAE